MFLRKIEKSEGVYYNEENYTYKIGSVTDEDVFDGYTKEEIEEKIRNADDSQWFLDDDTQ